MNLPVPALLSALRRSLQDEVLPEVASDHARSQLAGVVDTLAKLERMLVWSPDLLRERLAACDEVAAAVAARAAAAGFAGPERPPAAADAATSQAALEQALRSAERHLVTLIDWVHDQDAAMPAALAHELQALLRAAMRRALVAERRLVPRADFSAMTVTDAAPRRETPC